MLLRIGGYEISAYNGLVVSLERWNSPYPSRKKVILRYHNSGRECSYSYKELARIGAAIRSVLDSSDKRISFGQRWKSNGDWDWVLIVENSKYILVYGCHDPITLDEEAIKENRWYKGLRPILGEFATTGLIALEFDSLLGVERKQRLECQEESHEPTQAEAS
jgi:hypothetical protein